MNTITAIAKNLINLLYPLHCATCRKSLGPLDEYGVCDLCRSRIRQAPKMQCTSMPVRAGPYFSAAYSACVYEDVLKELIHLFKYDGKRSLSRILTKMMIDFIKDNGEVMGEAGIVTFVGLHKRRLRERGFNQSGILASGISRHFGIPLVDALEKTSRTRNQNELTKDERLVNVSGAFRVRTPSVPSLRGRAVLLVDDVMTTGATLNECSRVLLEAGAKEVRCFALARGL